MDPTCSRIAANDATLTHVHTYSYSHNAVIRALQTQQQQWNGNINNNRSNNPIQIQKLTLSSVWEMTVESLMQLLSLLCHRTAINNPCTTAVPMESSQQQHLLPSSSSSSSLKSIELCSWHNIQNMIDVVQSLFHGMAMDQPPGLGLVEDVSLVSMRVNWNESMAQALRDALMSPHCRLVKLQLVGNELTDDVMQWLALGFPSSQNSCNNTLTELDLSENEIGDAGAQQLARMLPFFHSLHTLDLGNNPIADDGAVALAAVLSQRQQQQQNNDHRWCAALTTLKLESNQIGDVGVVALIQAIRSHPTLAHWIIHYNKKIQLKGHQALVDSIPHLGIVQKLELGPFPSPCRAKMTNVAAADANTTPIPSTTTAIVAQLMRKLAAGMEQNHFLQEVLLSFHAYDRTDLSAYHLHELAKSHVEAMINHTSVIPPHLSEQLQWQLAASSPSSSSDYLDMLESVHVISFFSNLNRSKLRLVLLSPSPHQHHDSTQPPQIGLQLWPLILARLQHVPSLVFYMLQKNTTLARHRDNSSAGNKKRACQELVGGTTSKRSFVMHL